MDGIMLEHREKLIDLQGNLEKAELGMQPLMGADAPNDAAIVAQIDKVVQARGELERANARFLLAIRDKLTPDQWKQMKDFRADGGMRGMEQRQRWGQDGQRPGMHGQGMQGPGMQGPGGQGPGCSTGTGRHRARRLLLRHLLRREPRRLGGFGLGNRAVRGYVGPLTGPGQRTWPCEQAFNRRDQSKEQIQLDSRPLAARSDPPAAVFLFRRRRAARHPATLSEHGRSLSSIRSIRGFTADERRAPRQVAGPAPAPKRDK